jgi:hypothetical protein
MREHSMKSKYSIIQDLKIPQEKRTEINNKILALVSNGISTTLTKNEIFNLYSEKGGNHEIVFSDYENFYAFSKAKKFVEEGQFFTPNDIVKNMYDLISPKTSDLIADLTSGKGNFANYAPVESNFYGCEIDRSAFNVSRHLFPNANLECNDLKYYKPEQKFDIVFGNPPFNIKIDSCLSQFYYFKKAAALMNNGAFLILVTPTSFLNDPYLSKNQISEIEAEFHFLGQEKLNSNAFKNANISTKISVWQKKSESLEYSLEYKNEFLKHLELKELVIKYKTITESVMFKLTRENRIASNHSYSFSNPTKNISDDEVSGFEFKLNKYLYEISKQSPEKINIVRSMVSKYRNQTRDSNLSNEAWEEIRIKQIDVIRFAYSHVTTKKRFPADNISKKKLNRKKRLLKTQQIPFSDMNKDSRIANYVNSISLFDKNKKAAIELTAIQKEDINLALQKRYTYKQWEQGSGKTISGIVQSIYRLKNNQVNKIIVVAPSIAINGTWSKILDAYSLSNKVVSSAEDLNLINGADFILVTFGYLVKYRKQFKKIMKLLSNKTLLLLDEADNISNIYSNRCEAVLDVFKHSKYKTLLSGTMTRNNISEAFTQFYLMYGSSSNFVTQSERVFFEDSKGELKTKENPYFNRPFPSHSLGQRYFTASFNPSCSSVFGVEKKNQNVFNADDLNRIISYSIITRTFDEIKGKSIYKISQEPCNFNIEENNLYGKIIEEFYKIRDRYFDKIGDSRKDSMMAIIQQINLLLKACSVSHTFDEVTSNNPSSKISKVLSMIGKEKNHIAIGCTRIDTVIEYQKFISKTYPERKLFIITGAAAPTIESRLSIVNEMKKTKGSILVCTQQSLSSSLDIDFVDTILIPEMNWNNASMSQFYFRFIRFTSETYKNVIFITHAYSIESNLLQLILNKHKLNMFMKSDDLSMNELYDVFGVDNSIEDMFMIKVKDEEGNTSIRWKNSSIAS